eukprot:9982097-Lingulodinium_polyedra.AAC.1
MALSSEGVVFRHPALRPRGAVVVLKRKTAILTLLTLTRGCPMRLGVALKGRGPTPEFADGCLYR